MRHGFLASRLRSVIGLAAGLTMTLGAAATVQAADGTFVLASTYLIDRLYPHPQTAGTQLYVDVLFDPLVTVTKEASSRASLRPGAFPTTAWS